MIQSCEKDYYFEMEEPIWWEMEGNSMSGKSWDITVGQLTEEHPEVEFVVCVAPSKGRSSPVYQDIKRACHRIGLPTQVVLKNTISKGKNLRNIAKNVLIQI